VVVADKKTSTDWAYPNVDFLSVEMQQNLPFKIASLLPSNNYGCAEGHFSRKWVCTARQCHASG
jgi:hypothetical protein